MRMEYSSPPKKTLKVDGAMKGNYSHKYLSGHCDEQPCLCSWKISIYKVINALAGGSGTKSWIFQLLIIKVTLHVC